MLIQRQHLYSGVLSYLYIQSTNCKAALSDEEGVSEADQAALSTSVRPASSTLEAHHRKLHHDHRQQPHTPCSRFAGQR